MPLASRHLAFACLLALLLPASLPAAAQPAVRSRAALASYIDGVLDAEAFTTAHWGVRVTDAHTGEVLYARNAEEAFVPASNQKLFTVAAALDQLGPDYRYRTRLYTDGPVIGETLQGNLIVRGAGDPSLGGYEQQEDERAMMVFNRWADALKTAGISRIAGDLIGDDDIFDDVPLGAGWSWDDLPYTYSAEVGGLVFHENRVDFQIEGQTAGSPASVRWIPLNTDYVEVVNATRTIPSAAALDEEYRRKLGTNRIYLASRVPAGATDREELTISNPTLFFVHVLREVLLKSGIAVSGEPVDVDTMPIDPDYGSEALEQVAVYVSAPLADIATTLLQESHNLYAEQLLRTLGAERPVYDTEEDLEPGSAEMGIEAAKRTFRRAGINLDRIELADGSGLSRYNLVTPTAVVQLLRYMRTHPDDVMREAFLEALPVGGVHGTLEHRFRGEPAYRNVRAKTGTLTHVSALSGYVTTAAGRLLIFSILCNNHTVETWQVQAAQDRIVNALAAAQL